MKKKNTNDLIRCADCKHSQYTPTANKDDPKIIYCAVFERRFVANSLRKCLSFDS